MIRASAPLVTVVVVVVASAAGCATPNPHAEIPRAPSSEASYEERAAYYKTYSLDTREADHMFLHGGTRVYWPEDLLPAVDDKSPAAMAIRDHVSARAKVEDKAWLSNIAVGGMGIGLIALPGMLVPLLLPIPEEQQKTALFGIIGVGGASLALGFGAGIVDMVLVGDDADRAGEAADRAARTYPQALSDRLGIGVDANGNIVDHVMPSVTPPASTGQASPAGHTT